MDVVFGFADRVIVLHLGEVHRRRRAGRSARRCRGCARCTLATLEVARAERGLRPRAGAVRRRARGRAGRGRRAARPQRRRQIDHVEGDHGPARGAPPARCASTGSDIDGLEPYEIARLGLGYVPEERRIFTDLTVAENLEVGRQPPRSDAPAWSDEKLFALFPALGAMLRERARRAHVRRRAADAVHRAHARRATRARSCSTSPPKDSRRSSSSRWRGPSSSSRPPASPCCSPSRAAHFAERVADRS